MRGAPARDAQRLIEVADSLARRSGGPDVLEWLATDLAAALRTRVSIFEGSDRGWMLVGQSPGRLRASLADLDRVLNALPGDSRVSSLDLRLEGEGTWTALALEHPRERPIRILLSGDWTAFADHLTPFTTLLSFALRCAGEKSTRERADRLLRRNYAFGRRVSRLDGLQAACQGIVDQLSLALNAGRVALALYRPEEDRLVIAATRGYPASTVKDVRIEPGSWVIGHVFLTGRPILVRDIARIHRAPVMYRQYRTASFAAAPMFAGSETVGVLSATDKRDDSAFDQHDAMALRTFSVTAALAVAAARNGEEADRLSYAATADTLTGLFNRSYLDQRLHQELERARRAATPLAVLLLDIDDFKQVNDTHGHQVGDTILHVVGDILKSTVRVFDICARFGGDEFAILMPGSDHAKAVASAERIRVRVSSHTGFPFGSGLTISIGVAVGREGDGPADLIRRADQCLYQAKADGKNRVGVRPDGQGLGTVVLVPHDNAARGEPCP